MKAATGGSSAQPAGSHTRSSSAASRPARYRPAMMTAFIPKVDSCNAADLTRRDFFLSLSLPPCERSQEETGRGGGRGGGGGGEVVVVVVDVGA